MWPTGETVARTVPRGFDAVHLAQNRNLPRRREAAGLGKVHADVVDEAFRHQWDPLVRTVEEFAHGDRRSAILSDLPEIAEVLR